MGDPAFILWVALALGLGSVVWEGARVRATTRRLDRLEGLLAERIRDR